MDGKRAKLFNKIVLIRASFSEEVSMQNQMKMNYAWEYSKHSKQRWSSRIYREKNKASYSHATELSINYNRVDSYGKTVPYLSDLLVNYVALHAQLSFASYAATNLETRYKRDS